MSKEPWEKVLWKEQPYPDDYVPERLFLSSLRKNPNFKPYTYWPLVLLSGAISQHLASVFIFLDVFMLLHNGHLHPRILVCVAVACFLVGYTVWEIYDRRLTRHGHDPYKKPKTIKSSILLFFSLLCLAPVLRTLTAATSSDSIWALSACLFVLNALLADYTALEGRGPLLRLSSVLSTNAAISASVVLASRLPYDLAVFALVLFSVQSFALFPILRRRLQTTSPPVQIILTVALASLALALTTAVSVMVTYIYATAFAFVTFVAPALLVWAQQYKNEIRGQWDAAVPRIH
ncbi:phosphatidylinositol N-acetylglucosaminyltransferase [Fistulina hepatica ATCC 64428]|uniref:Phosphatidylinositol N-acetylglucosaminyltransferase n=1 Tax=Fistulina hepatica ATCC 64428 TaxID=1128425 RepID=A0A0D7ALY3_9AGAR|nr:phosphatidylinositol N-acetylglucosaminyltransferase [Fistulina hepatica ATCC 64428]